MGLMTPEAARAEFDRLREKFERELREKAQTYAEMDGEKETTSSVTAAPCHLPLKGKAFEEDDDGFWETEIRRE